MTKTRAAYMLVLLLVVVVLVGVAFFQTVRVVEPAALLPSLTAIEGGVALMNTPNPAVLALRQARAKMELAIADSASKGPARSRDSLEVLRDAAANLAIAENEVTRESTRVATLAAELTGRVKILKEQVGPPATLDRLAGLTVKDLLIAFSWPLCAMIAVLYFLGTAKGTTQLSSFIGQFRSLKWGAFEVVLGEELKQTAEQAFRLYREQAKTQFDSWAQRQKVRETLNRILEREVEPFFRETLSTFPDYRCTIHVPDLLFADSLYQLVDYAPKGVGPRGRAWSVRYGMMGKQWRLGQSEIRGDVTTDADDLIRDWGMTRAEARQAQLRKSLLCAVLRQEMRDPIGILYLDAANANAFGTPEQAGKLLQIAEEACTKHGLIDSLATLQNELFKQAPLIRIYG